MSELSAIFAISLAIAMGAISPGPSFLVIARSAAFQGKRFGINASFGMGAGSALFALAALLGLKQIFATIPMIFFTLKFVGGLYLAYLGFQVWKGSKNGISDDNYCLGNNSGMFVRGFWLGFFTQVSNPKTAIIYASIFAALVPPSHDGTFDLTIIVLDFAIESIWYAFVTLILSSEKSKKSYLGFKSYIDKGAAGLLVALGIKMAVSSKSIA